MAENFDPRFHARFQPGYQGESSAAELSGPEVVVVDEPAAIAEIAHTEQRGDDIEQLVDDTEQRGDDEREQNPFERTLWFVAAALVVGGLVLSYWGNSINFMGGAGNWSFPQMIQSSSWALAGPMITVGLATAVALLFRRAITWKPAE